MMDCDGLCVVIPIQVIELITLYYITLHYKIKVITFAVEIKVPYTLFWPVVGYTSIY